jgi:hypothetical protein
MRGFFKKIVIVDVLVSRNCQMSMKFDSISDESMTATAGRIDL